jgi:hypothetical protein
MPSRSFFSLGTQQKEDISTVQYLIQNYYKPHVIYDVNLYKIVFTLFVALLVIYQADISEYVMTCLLCLVSVVIL